MEFMWNRQKITGSVLKVMIIADATDSCFHWKGQDAVGWGKVKSSTHVRRR
jgi:hypothetical protein